LSHGGGDGVGFGAGRGGERQTESAKVVVLVVVAVPAAVVLRQEDGQRDGAVGVFERLFQGEDGLPRLVAAAGAGVGPPRRLVLAVDGERDRAGDALLVALSS